MSPTTFHIGDSVDRFRVLGRHGQGRWGDVFLVEHRVLGSRHLLSMLPGDRPPAAWLRAAARYARLDDDKVVAVHDAFETDRGVAVLTPLAAGVPMSRLLDAGPLTGDAAAHLLRGVARSLQEAHRHGVTHGDVRAEWVWVEPHLGGLRVRLRDFGGRPTPVADDREALVALGRRVLIGQEPLPPWMTAMARAPSVADILDRLPDRAADAELLARLATLSGPHAEPSETSQQALVGRERERRLLQRAVRSRVPFVTLHGPGGIGKTALARDLVTRCLAVGTDALVCDVHGFDTLPAAAQRIARTLGGAAFEAAPVRTVAELLAARPPAVLVLDGAEGVAGIAPALQQWHRAAPGWVFVTTTRRRLGLPDQQVVPVRPLSPEASAELVRRRLDGRTDLDDDALAALVQRTDGVPLALELAAGLAAAHPEHAPADGTAGGLDACLAASWSMLDAEQRSVLGQLTLFEGTFTLDDAEAVVRADDPWLLDVLQDLVDYAMLRAVGPGRYRLLTSVRRLAAARIDAPLRAAAILRHAERFAALGTLEACAAAVGTNHPGAVERQAAAMPDVHRSLARLPQDDHHDIAACLARAYWLACRFVGPFAEGQRLCEATLRRPLDDVDFVSVAACAVEASVQGSRSLGDPRWLDAMARRADASGEGFLQALAYEQCGRRAGLDGRIEAAASFHERAERAYRAAGSLVGAHISSARAIQARTRLGAMSPSSMADAAEQLARASDDLTGLRAWRALAGVLLVRGTLAHEAGRRADAVELFQLAAARAHACADLPLELKAQRYLAYLGLRQGHPEAATFVARTESLTTLLHERPTADLAVLYALGAWRRADWDAVDTHLATVVERHHNPHLQAYWMLRRAHLHEERGAFAEAEALVAAARERSTLDRVRRHGAWVLARSLRRRGRLDDARAALATAPPALDADGLQVRAERGLLCAARGDQEGVARALRPFPEAPALPVMAVVAWAELTEGPLTDEQRARLGAVAELVGPHTAARLDRLRSSLAP